MPPETKAVSVESKKNDVKGLFVSGEGEHVAPSVLNERIWATIKPSSIHGVGVFAIRDVPAGQKLYLQGGIRHRTHTDLEALHPAIRALIKSRWPVVRDGHPFLTPHDDVFLASWLNHSDAPNYDQITDTALFPINEGEEITEDYGKYRDFNQE